ncbi:MAG: Qat anti-phage system ATPase QatA [Gluconobacter sp.]|uniref:Qat anti-phage system ATPase QatA n=1 Tax=Gluconobacter sp. TaxID=1876758 RepID=UPI0039E74FBD
MFLNDQETATDLLYYEAIAKTVVRLIGNTGEAPVTIGVHGDWGAGKSSVLKMTEAAVAKEPKTVCIWFNGWAFEGFEDAKTVVMETIVDELRRARPTSTKVADAAKKLLKRIDWLKIARKAGGLVFTAATGIPTLDQIRHVVDLASSVISSPQDHISMEKLRSAAKEAKDYLKEGKEEAERLPDHIHEFRKEFVQLLDAAEITKLVVIVDDLDRCLPKTAVATLEAIRLFLLVDRTAFVIGADELMIEYAVREHFPDLPPASGPIGYARNYLEKLIQVPFRVPALGPAETRVYITLLLAEAALGSVDGRFLALIEAAREDMRLPWKSRGFDHATVQQACDGAIPQPVGQAQMLAAQVTGILTEGTGGNPRQIKRFLNTLLLREAIAEERGLSSEIATPVLAKIMLAERFYPAFYEQVSKAAAADPRGIVEALGHLEDDVRGVASGGPVPAALEGDWAKNEWARRWAGIDPKLKGVDLRPYVFVTRDKRGVLGGLVAASHLEAIVERLMGPTLTAKGAADDVGRLPAPEAEEILEVICRRIVETDAFLKKPKGVDGIDVIVKKHPGLQRRVIDFLKGLPTEKLGAWAPTSWANTFTDQTVAAEFEALREGWAQSGNAALKTAAELTSKRRGR